MMVVHTHKRQLPFILLMLLSVCNVHAQKTGQALIDSLRTILPTAKDDTNKVRILNMLGTNYCTINPDTGMKFGVMAEQLADKLSWQNGVAGAYNVQGMNSFYKTDFKAALDYWQKALKIFTQTGNRSGVMKVTGNIGALYEYQGDYAHALENHFLSLKYAEEAGDSNSIASNLGNIGATYQYLKDYPKALDYNQRALTIFQKKNIQSGVATHLGNIGNIYIDLKQYEKALDYEQRALKVNETLGNTDGIVRDMLNIGYAYNYSRKYNMALSYFFKALKRARDASFKVQEAKALSSIGEALIAISEDSTGEKISEEMAREHSIANNKKGLNGSAIDYLTQSIAINSSINNLIELLHNYEYLSKAQSYVGDYKNALENHKKFTVLQDSVFSAENKITVTNLETQREIDLKNKQIIIDQLAVAKKRNERVFFIGGIVLLLAVVVFVIRNIKLSTAKELSENKLNAFQARMNPHFIFNSLSSIQSLILNNETEQSIDYLSEFSSLMRQILDNSFKSKVVLKTEIDMLRSYIELEHLRFETFSWSIDIDENVSQETIEVPGMVVQPFVENAILHGLVSKGKEGVLTIRFKCEGGQVICTVEDNGIGREKSFEINRSRNKNRQSHGVNIAINRLTLLNDKKKGLINKIEYIDKAEDGQSTGTKVIIQLPIL